MSGRVYYNEIEPFKAAWLRELIARKVIAAGEVDERSIAEVAASDLAGFIQCHFFAGIGAWSYALRRAGWADDTPVWTGSCPCQPFSDAGKGAGADDPRHLWPAWFRLIREHCHDVVFGEQVASKDGLPWLDVVSTDLEGAGYAFGAADLCAAGVGAPHKRQRLYFVAESNEGRRAIVRAPRLHDYRQPGYDVARRGTTRDVGNPEGERSERRATERREARRGAQHASEPRELVDAERARLEGNGGDEHDGCESGRLGTESHGPVGEAGALGDVGHASSGGRGERGDPALARISGHADSTILSGFWRDADWIACRKADGSEGIEWRPVEPRTFPLAHGAAARVGRLRGYGDAIVADLAMADLRR